MGGGVGGGEGGGGLTERKTPNITLAERDLQKGNCTFGSESSH